MQNALDDVSLPTHNRPQLKATEAGAAIVAGSAVAQGVVTWVRLGDLPLDARWVIAGVLAVGVLVGAALVLSVHVQTWSRRRRVWTALACSLAGAALTVLFLNLSTTYHSILVIQESCRASRPGWRCVEYRPARDATDLDVRLSVRDRRLTSEVKWSPGFWSPSRSSTWILQNENEHELTVRLSAFRTPDRFGVAYRPVGSPDLILEQVGVDPSSVRVILENELATCRSWFLAWGGLLWLAAALLLYFWPLLASWVMPKRPRETRILEP